MDNVKKGFKIKLNKKELLDILGLSEFLCDSMNVSGDNITLYVRDKLCNSVGAYEDGNIGVCETRKSIIVKQSASGM